MPKILSSHDSIEKKLEKFLELAGRTYRRLIRLRELPEEEPFWTNIGQWRAILASKFQERAQAYRSCSDPSELTSIVVEVAQLFVQEVQVRASHEGHLLLSLCQQRGNKKLLDFVKTPDLLRSLTDIRAPRVALLKLTEDHPKVPDPLKAYHGKSPKSLANLLDAVSRIIVSFALQEA
jgi:hypothetical protein